MTKSEQSTGPGVVGVAGERLLPCPFCGGNPRIVEPHESGRSLDGETDEEEWLSFVECDCVDMFFVKGSSTSQDEARSAVVGAWNRRDFSPGTIISGVVAAMAMDAPAPPMTPTTHPATGEDA